jgi:putative transposase
MILTLEVPPPLWWGYFNKDSNHCISKRIANLPYDVFVLEKLSIRPQKRLGKSFNKRLMGWSWKQLEQFLGYKAELLGKRVEYVDARYTSQKCSVCGHVKRSNRDGTQFLCTQCSFQLHADLNAARNIKHNFLEAQRATSSLSRVPSTTHTSQELSS